MAIYNETCFDTAYNLVLQAKCVALATGAPSYLFGNLALLGFFMIFVFFGVRDRTLEVMSVGAAITVLVAIIFTAAGFVTGSSIVLALAIFVITIIINLLVR